MDPELKSMLTVLLDKVERIDATVTRVEAEQCEMKEELRQIKDEQRQIKDEQRQIKDEQRQIKDEQRQMKDEQRQMKEMLGVVRLKEIGRLDGRIDQLAMDVALGRKPDAA